jgi:hypothetical protein
MLRLVIDDVEHARRSIERSYDLPKRAAVFLMAGAVIAGQLLRRGAVASLEITGVRDKPVVTAPDASGDPIPLNV